VDIKKDKQLRLIVINNLCTYLSVTIEKRYNTPDAAELIEIIMKLVKECKEYLKICSS
jgi:hypothetical protein